MSDLYDAIIIGCGVTGAWSAYELSRYRLKIAIVEKENDIGCGTTKANSAIVHAGYDPEPGTLKAAFNVRGNELIRGRAKRMAIPFNQCGSYVIAFDAEGMNAIIELYNRGLANGVPDMKLLTAAEVHEAEPNLADDVCGALLAQSAGIISPFELCCAPTEVAVRYGADLLRNFEVVSMVSDDEKVTVTAKDGRVIEGKRIINAAGLYADDMARMLGDDSFKITPKRGEYSILDSNVYGIVDHVIFQPPSKAGKGILVSPTVDGNVLVGPTSDPIDFKDDLKTTDDGQKRAFDGARKSVPSISERDVITSFSGNRSVGDQGDFICSISSVEPKLINLAGIESPGLTSAPAIAEYAAGLLRQSGIELVKREKFDDTRTVIRFKELDDFNKHEIIQNDPAYGRIICRCETITEGEIVDAIHRPAGALDMDGVKRRVRAGMGRCQGGFCGPRVMEILSRELGIPMTKVTKFGGRSYMVIGREELADD
ncbi:MAG: FAD-dependent oxidoreductase [Eubacteriaceae bacterium]|nr:FAD-dependent oxidoreductase [Eubacteriaceae bacterium]